MFFPEKRPFFLENASFFQTPENLFFSRRIIDPRFGARVTGKLGAWALGLLAVDDEEPARAGDGRGRAAIGVVRLQRDLGRESSAGVLLTTRRVNGRVNQVASADLRWKLGRNWVVSAQGIRSTTETGGGTRRAGLAWFGDAQYAGRRRYAATFRERSREFESDLARAEGGHPGTRQEVTYRWRLGRVG